MSVVVGDLLVKLALENSQYKAELEKSRRQSEQDTNIMQKGADLVGKAWQMAGPVVVGALAAIGTATVAAIGMGSDLNETVNKTGVVFGTASKDILEFSTSTAGALGQSQQAALDAAATFGIFGKSAGLAGDDLSDFSIDLTTLASDLASFHNASPEEAVVALGAALRGESEPIRRFGVLLDEATLKQKALEMGLISTTANALTPQQRVLAAYNAILEQTADAQGDFANTSDGLANTQRILKAELTDLATQWGTALLPVVQEFAGEAIPVLIEGLEVLTDAHLPAFVTLIGQTADGLLTAFDAGMLLVTWTERIDTAYQQHADTLITNTDNYKAYSDEILRSLVVSQEINQHTANWIAQKIADGEAVDIQAEAYGFLTAAQYEYMKRAKETEAAELSLAIARANSGVATHETVTAVVSLNSESTLLKDALATLAVDGFDPAATAANLLKDGLNAVTDSAVEAQRVSLVLAIAEKTRQLNTEDLTQAQKEQLSSELELMLNQQSELANLESLNQAYEAGTITKYDWIAAVSDGIVTQTELNTLLGQTNDALSTEEEELIGVNAGMLNTTGATNDYTQTLLDLEAPLTHNAELLGVAKDEAGGLNDQLNAIPRDIDITFNLHTNGEMPNVGGYGGGAPTGPTTPTAGLRIDEPPVSPAETGQDIGELNRWFSQLTPEQQALVEQLVYNRGLSFADALAMVGPAPAGVGEGVRGRTGTRGRGGDERGPVGFNDPVPGGRGEGMETFSGGGWDGFQVAGGAGLPSIQIHGDVYVMADDPAAFLEQLYALQR